LAGIFCYKLETINYPLLGQSQLMDMGVILDDRLRGVDKT